jgi:peptidoglycan hydrolase-like protein with peptidoglycan-binding domain
VFEDKIMAALKMARAFTPNAKVHITTPTGPKLVKFRETLFPRYWFLPSYQQTQLPMFTSDPLTLRFGSGGSHVSMLQTLINGVVASSISLQTDGIFGPKTHSAVQSFQRMAGLVVDGAVGHRTRRSLVA